MTKTTIYCDHCGAELDEIVDYTESEIETPRYLHKCDLCRTCAELLDEKIKEFLNKEEK